MVRHPIKLKWFVISVLGIKGEEYRDLKPYWEKRYRNELGDEEVNRILYEGKTSKAFYGLYHVGYGKNVPQFVSKVKLHVGTGKEEWGAEPGKVYFVAEYIGPKEIKNWNN